MGGYGQRGAGRSYESSVGRRKLWDANRRSARNGCAAVQRVVTEGRLPVPGDEQLGTIQELGAEQESPGKIGAVEHRFEEVCPLQAGPRQIRICALCSPKVGASKVRSRKIKPAQIEPAQGGPR